MIVTSALSVGFFRGQVARLKDAGYRVSLISSPGPQTAEIEAEGAEIFALPIERGIFLFKDLIALWRLWRVLRNIRPNVTNVGTPKAGLLGGIAARLAGVPHRVYTLHGLRLETASGWKRKLLAAMERVACCNAQYIRCVSPSLRDKVVELGLADAEKTYVIGPGTANGIDTVRFCRTPERVLEAHELRRKLHIPNSAPLIGFVGRLTRDKGIAELYGAFVQLKKSFSELRLLLVGDFEDGDPVPEAVRRGLKTEPNVVFTGMVADTAPYYALMDILAFPTLREGFGLASLEAQASGVPVVTTSVTGAVDSIIDGVTGKLVAPGNEAALADALCDLLSNPETRQRLGDAAKRWVNDHFRNELVWQGLIADYDRISKN